MVKICAICDSGTVRSRATRYEIINYLRNNGIDAECFSAGVHNHDFNSYPLYRKVLKLFSYLFMTPLTKGLVDRTDKFFVMEERQKKRLEKEHGINETDIICLYIEDIYINPFSKKLKEEIDKKLKPYLYQFFPILSDASS